MPKKPRVKRAQTGTAHAETKFWSAPSILQPPAQCKLPEEAQPFWESIIRTRNLDFWTEVDLDFAAQLAMAQYHISTLNDDIIREGPVVEDARGNDVMNPKLKVVDSLSRRALVIARHLHVHPKATSGEASKEGPANRASANAQRLLAEEHDLLPTMQSVQ